MKKKKRRPDIDKRALWIGVVLTTLIAVAYVAQFWDTSISDEPADWGVFGDYIGGLASSVIAAVALFLFWRGVTIQKKELNETRREFARQRFENSFFHLVGLVAEHRSNHQPGLIKLSDRLVYDLGRAQDPQDLQARYEECFSDAAEVWCPLASWLLLMSLMLWRFDITNKLAFGEYELFVGTMRGLLGPSEAHILALGSIGGVVSFSAAEERLQDLVWDLLRQTGSEPNIRSQLERIGYVPRPNAPAIVSVSLDDAFDDA